MREVRRAFLEADVNFTVVNDFIAQVEKKAVGADVLARINPGEQIVKIVYDELVTLMGPVDHKIPVFKDRPTVLMMCGLQGAGKTTTCGKLALRLRDQGRRPLLVAADLQRPAAVDQLKVLGEQTRHAGLQRGDHPRPGVQERRRVRQDELLRRGHPRHRRPAPDRQGVDGGSAPDRPAGQPGHGLPRRGRHDRPGGGERRPGVPRRVGAERPDPDEAGRRRPRRGGAVDQARHGGADQVRRRRREADKPWRSSTRSGWRPASWARAT